MYKYYIICWDKFIKNDNEKVLWSTIRNWAFDNLARESVARWSAPWHIRPQQRVKFTLVVWIILLSALVALTTTSVTPQVQQTPSTTMADTAAPVKKVAAKKAAKPKKPASHPKYAEMIVAAITSLKDRTGSSAQAIKKYISANYKVEDKSVGPQVRLGLRRGVASGMLKQVKGTGASGSFKVAEKATKPKKVVKKAAAKKPAAKKATKSPKKAAKKTATKKTAAKKATKSPKKSTKKAKSPAAKKPKAKKAAKKPAAKKAPAKK